MKQDVLAGAMYGLIVPIVMPFIAYWTRKVSYRIFFACGALGIPVSAFVSMGLRAGWTHSVDEVLPRVLTLEGILIMAGFGCATVFLVWIARLSGFVASERVNKQ